MLFRKAFLAGIAAGRITVAFRRWRRPTVRSGGNLKTAIGVLDISEVAEIRVSEIRKTDVEKAGFESKAALLDELAKGNGSIYCIRFTLGGPDPRIALREDSDPSGTELERIVGRVVRFDATSKAGPWALPVMEEIESNPGRPAREIAAALGFEKDWLKTRIRRLKDLGLTISLETGYEISPRGKVVLESLKGLGS